MRSQGDQSSLQPHAVTVGSWRICTAGAGTSPDSSLVDTDPRLPASRIRKLLLVVYAPGMLCLSSVPPQHPGQD